jgi:predicted RNA-binding Zn-ribbon protein involved in translation (DUF1610 family)
MINIDFVAVYFVIAIAIALTLIIYGTIGRYKPSCPHCGNSYKKPISFSREVDTIVTCETCGKTSYLYDVWVYNLR